MAGAGAVGAYGLVGNVAGAAFEPIVNGDLANGAEGFVIESRDAESGAQFLVEAAEILQVRGQRWQLDAFVGKQKFLVAGVPQTRDLALDHNGRSEEHTSE